jgi:hypothetical protein
MAYKILGSQSQANTTTSQFANNRVIRLANIGTASRTITLNDNTKQLNLTINASANATTLLTLSSGDTTGVVVGYKILGSSNVSVVNTGVASVVASIVNSTAITCDVDIIVANGTASVYTTAPDKTFSILPNTEFVIEKGRWDFLKSDSDTDVVAIPVSYRG